MYVSNILRLKMFIHCYLKFIFIGHLFSLANLVRDIHTSGWNRSSRKQKPYLRLNSLHWDPGSRLQHTEERKLWKQDGSLLLKWYSWLKLFPDTILTRRYFHFYAYGSAKRSDQSLSRVWLFVTPWITALQTSLSITISRSSLKLMSI